MTWFRVDDRFHAHPKVMEAGNAAIGLFVRLGAYCADHLTDGLIPHGVARAYGTRKEIETLLDVGLWVDTGSHYHMPDYLDYNPSKESVLAERQAAKDRMARRRSGNVRPNTQGTSDDVRVPRPDPTRPDQYVLQTDDDSESVPQRDESVVVAEERSFDQWALEVCDIAARVQAGRRRPVPANPRAWIATTARSMRTEREPDLRSAWAMACPADLVGQRLADGHVFVVEEPVEDVPPARDVDREEREAYALGRSIGLDHLADDRYDIDLFVAGDDLGMVEPDMTTAMVDGYRSAAATEGPALRVINGGGEQ